MTGEVCDWQHMGMIPSAAECMIPWFPLCRCYSGAVLMALGANAWCPVDPEVAT